MYKKKAKYKLQEFCNIINNDFIINRETTFFSFLELFVNLYNCIYKFKKINLCYSFFL